MPAACGMASDLRCKKGARSEREGGMKKLVIGIALATALCGCGDWDEQYNRPYRDYLSYSSIGHTKVCKFEFEGHHYLYVFGGGICHAENCPCLKGGEPK